MPGGSGVEDDTVEKGDEIGVGQSWSTYNFKVSGYSFFQFIIGGGAHSNARDRKI